MQNKKIIILSLAFIIIISALGYFYFIKGGKNNFYSKINKNTEITETKTVNIEDKKITEDISPFKIDITYPEISGYDNFNNLAKNIIDTEISEFKTNSLENDKAVKETDPETYAKYPRQYDLIISYDKGQIDNDITSVVFDISNFEGGAHGAQYQISLNYNLKDNKKIELADLFQGQENYIQKISDYCIADLTKQVLEKVDSTEGLYIQDGAGPVADNFNVFLINKNNITFYFPQYQIAPYVFGGFKVVMPR